MLIFFKVLILVNILISLFQKQISSTAWPSDAYLPKVSAKYGHDDASEPDFVNHEINVAINLNDTDVDGVKGKLMEQYMKYVSKNLLEVKTKVNRYNDLDFLELLTIRKQVLRF